jgi:hypothetical protein
MQCQTTATSSSSLTVPIGPASSWNHFISGRRSSLYIFKWERIDLCPTKNQPIQKFACEKIAFEFKPPFWSAACRHNAALSNIFQTKLLILNLNHHSQNWFKPTTMF